MSCSETLVVSRSLALLVLGTAEAVDGARNGVRESLCNVELDSTQHK